MNQKLDRLEAAMRAAIMAENDSYCHRNEVGGDEKEWEALVQKKFDVVRAWWQAKRHEVRG